jgi:hypothetical protein
MRENLPANLIIESSFTIVTIRIKAPGALVPAADIG